MSLTRWPVTEEPGYQGFLEAMAFAGSDSRAFVVPEPLQHNRRFPKPLTPFDATQH